MSFQFMNIPSAEHSLIINLSSSNNHLNINILLDEPNSEFGFLDRYDDFENIIINNIYNDDDESVILDGNKSKRNELSFNSCKNNKDISSQKINIGIDDFLLGQHINLTNSSPLCYPELSNNNESFNNNAETCNDSLEEKNQTKEKADSGKSFTHQKRKRNVSQNNAKKINRRIKNESVKEIKQRRRMKQTYE